MSWLRGSKKKDEKKRSPSPGEYAVALDMLKNVISHPIYSI